VSKIIINDSKIITVSILVISNRNSFRSCLIKLLPYILPLETASPGIQGTIALSCSVPIVSAHFHSLLVSAIVNYCCELINI